MFTCFTFLLLHVPVRISQKAQQELNSFAELRIRLLCSVLSWQRERKSEILIELLLERVKANSGFKADLFFAPVSAH